MSEHLIAQRSPASLRFSKEGGRGSNSETCAPTHFLASVCLSLSLG